MDNRRLEGESIKHWLNRTAIGDTERFHRKMLRRQKYAWYYNIMFNIQVLYLKIKKRIKERFNT